MAPFIALACGEELLAAFLAAYAFWGSPGFGAALAIQAPPPILAPIVKHVCDNGTD
jgi:hypothetical protein